ncbi:MAG: hypothetical protein M3441_27110, partial [Chloroflexota bacterium]|nr:hypothetical protein [Chloroflexota bacterium]
LLASGLGVLASVVDEEHGMGLWATLPLGKELPLLYTGLTVVGVATLLKDAPRLLGALVLASGALGWASLLTDPGFSGGPGADGIAPRRIRCVVLPELGGVGRGAL